MGIRSFLAGPVASLVASQTKKWASRPGYYQQQTFEKLVRDARHTAFGKDHGFSDVNSVESFRKQVPVRDYEGLKGYVE
ncbi:MAG TPA: GH3 auxin-responsive promoter family protein, partial [Cyclobacteriaceae bacterium]